ncbi:MAG: hypothetical protein HC934_03025 [Acaryochloridaceae cyanobacterium SU_2_1]|nr:hypothetical protein [Acaryochloridaceae cyanobacterium SU_2_1]
MGKEHIRGTKDAKNKARSIRAKENLGNQAEAYPRSWRDGGKSSDGDGNQPVGVFREADSWLTEVECQHSVIGGIIGQLILELEDQLTERYQSNEKLYEEIKKNDNKISKIQVRLEALKGVEHKFQTDEK